MIAARQHLPIPPMRRCIRRIELRDESVEKVSARLRGPIDDTQIGPAERYGASPLTSLAAQRPDTVLARRQHSANHARRVVAADLTADGGALHTPPRHFDRLGAAERSSNSKDSETLEEIRLPLGIRSCQDVEARRRGEQEALVAAKIDKFYRFNVHPISAPMGLQILMGMITQRDPSSSKLLRTPGLKPSFTSSTTCSATCAPRASST